MNDSAAASAGAKALNDPASGTSCSVTTRPGAMRAVPEVTASGLPEPASASPSASTACTLASMAAAMSVVVSEMLFKAA